MGFGFIGTRANYLGNPWVKLREQIPQVLNSPTGRGWSGNMSDKSPTVSASTEVDAFLTKMQSLTRQDDDSRRPADLRSRRDSEPATHMGYSLPTPGGHVSRGRYHRRAQRAAGLLSWSIRMPLVTLGYTARTPCRADGAHRLPLRPHPDRQGACPRPARKRAP